MPSDFDIVAIVYLPVAAILLATSISRCAEWCVLPSVIWGACIVVPAALMQGFDPSASARQAVSIGIVGVAVLLGDMGALAMRCKQKAPNPAINDSAERVALGLAILTMLIAAIHIYLMPTIPLADLLLGCSSSRELLEAREVSSKLLNVPKPLAWLFNQAPTVFAMSSCWIYAAHRKHVAAALIGCLGLLYAFITTSLTTGLMLISACALVVCLRVRHRLSFMEVTLAFVVLASVFCSVSVWLVNDLPKPANLPESQISGQPFTTADRFRTAAAARAISLNNWPRRVINRFVYRQFLTPVDVAHRWFLFFPEKAGGFMGLNQAVDSPELPGPAKSPANAVGLWAYRDRFPDRYLTSVAAYSSLDADAWARCGLVGVVAASLCLLAMRWIISLLGYNFPQIEELCAIAVLYIALLLPHASLQAILFAHGLIVLMGVIFIVGLVSSSWDEKVKMV